MMRARHQRSLSTPEGWLAKPRGCFKRRQLTYSRETARVSNIDHLEMGRDDSTFAPVVFTVVELQEEGLFRHITAYV